MNLKLALSMGLLMLFLLGCMETTAGKIPLVDGKLPSFFKVSKTTPAEVLNRFGEPWGYREYENRSVMIYEYYFHSAFFPAILHWENYRIYLVFEDNILKKTDVQRLQVVGTVWGAKSSFK
jgi:hypothetical protein